MTVLQCSPQSDITQVFKEEKTQTKVGAQQSRNSHTASLQSVLNQNETFVVLSRWRYHEDSGLSIKSR